MATISTAVPVEEYLRSSYDPDVEYIDGQLVERKGEYFHGRLQGLIFAALMTLEKGRFRALTEVRIRVSEAPRYRIPDVCVKALPHEKTPVLIGVDLAVEVLSQDDEPAEILSKIADYVGAGIPYIWIVDPYKRTLAVVENGVHRQVNGQVLETPLVGALDFAELFRRLDE
jgi:Uma2 family endonuclease